jgi:ArsR family transcriptional regulator
MRNTGRITIIDVREAAAYREGHIPGALSIPVSELDARAADLVDTEATIVTYCSCPAEETSMYAATLLRERGFRSVAVLKGGFPEWERRGMGRETGGR